MKKISAYIDEECEILLEQNGVLSSGRKSKFSDWLRERVRECYKDRNSLEGKQRQLSDIKEEMVTLEQEMVTLTNRKKFYQDKMVTLEQEIVTLREEKNKIEAKKAKDQAEKKIKDELVYHVNIWKDKWQKGIVSDEEYFKIFDIEDREEKLKVLKKQLNQINGDIKNVTVDI